MLGTSTRIILVNSRAHRHTNAYKSHVLKDTKTRKAEPHNVCINICMYVYIYTHAYIYVETDR